MSSRGTCSCQQPYRASQGDPNTAAIAFEQAGAIGQRFGGHYACQRIGVPPSMRDCCVAANAGSVSDRLRMSAHSVATRSAAAHRSRALLWDRQHVCRLHPRSRLHRSTAEGAQDRPVSSPSSARPCRGEIGRRKTAAYPRRRGAFPKTRPGPSGRGPGTSAGARRRLCNPRAA